MDGPARYRAAGSLAALLALAAPAHADDWNRMIGPVLGWAWPKHHPSGLFGGVEAGLGYGPERVNVGLSNRGNEAFGYVELDPWYWIGASLGVGIGSDTGVKPIAGIWEGMPITELCQGGDSVTVVTVSAGLRWTGAWELYVAPKVGRMAPICID